MNTSRRLTAFLMLLGAAGQLCAATITWSGTAGDQRWKNPGNWSSGTVPNAGDDIVLPAGIGTIIVEGVAARSIRVDGSVIFYVPDSPPPAGVPPSDYYPASFGSIPFTAPASASIEKQGPGGMEICLGGQYDGKLILSEGLVRSYWNFEYCLGSAIGSTEIRSGATFKGAVYPAAEPLIMSGGAFGISARDFTGPITLLADSRMGSYDYHFFSGAIDGPGRILSLQDANLWLIGHTYHIGSPLEITPGRFLALESASMPDVDIVADSALHVSLRGNVVTGKLSARNTKIHASNADLTAKDLDISGSSVYFWHSGHIDGTVNMTNTLGVVYNTAAGPVVLIENDGTDPVIGSFAARNDTTTRSEFQFYDRPPGQRFVWDRFCRRVFYDGGDGNDVVLVLESGRRAYLTAFASTKLCQTCSDLYFRDPYGGVGVWTMNGSSTVSGYFIGNTGADSAVTAIGDLDGESRADVVIRNKSTGDLTVWFAGGSHASLPLDPDYEVVGSADLDRDGKWDLVLRHKPTGAFGAWLMNGATIIRGGYIGQTSLDFAGLDDFDGDGRSDILLHDPNTGALGIWFLDGPTLRAGAYIDNLPAGYSVAATGDFNKDGRADILVRHDATGQLGAWLLDGSKLTAGFFVGAMTEHEYVVRADDYYGDTSCAVLLRDSLTGAMRMLKPNATPVESVPVFGTLPTIYETIP